MAEPVPQEKRLHRMSTLDRRNGWWSRDTIAVVTGGDRGVGHEITRQLGRLGLTVILAARNEDRGQNAADSLKAKGLAVVFHQLDVTDEDSIQTFVGWVKRVFGGINILINSAGIKILELSFDNAREVIFTNYVSLRAITQALLPIFKPSSNGGRIVNMSSSLGSLKFLKSDALRSLLSNEEKLSEELLNTLATKFLEDMTAEKYRSPSWPWAMHYCQYAESKVFVNAYTRVLARELAKASPEDQEIFVNSAVHMHAKQDITKQQLDDPKAAEQWADNPVWLALLPREGYPNGKFFTNRQETEF